MSDSPPSNILEGHDDAADTRDKRRRRKLNLVIKILLVVLAIILYHDFTTGGGVPSLHLSKTEIGMLPSVFMLLILVVLLGGPILAAGASPHILYQPEDMDVSLSDVRGLDSNREEIARTIRLFRAHKTFMDRMGGTARRGVLFEGPPGTGKTLTAKAMAKETGVPFLFVSGSSFQAPFYGQSGRRIRSFFHELRRQARTEGGAIGFIEEIDAIGAARANMRSQGDGIAGVVNELLIQLQSFDEPTRGERFENNLRRAVNTFLPRRMQMEMQEFVRPNVLVIAATNRKDDLDPALLRPGRFDRSIHFGLPGRPARADILSFYLSKKAHSPDLDSDGAVDELAAMTIGYSPADLERLLDEALIAALADGREYMEMKDVAQAKLTQELGLTDAAEYNEQERLRIASHEAGHGVVAYFVGEGRKLDVLSIVKRAGSLGLLQHSDTEDRYTRTREEMNAIITISMGGLAAEEIFFGDNPTQGPGGDLAAATRMGAAMIGGYGMGRSLISFEAADSGPMGGDLVSRVLADEKMRAELDELLQSSHARARRILEQERDVVIALREALLDRSELYGEEIITVIESVPGASARRQGYLISQES